MAEGATATIGSLELQIQSDASKAADGLTQLANSLGKIKELVSGGMQLGAFGNQLGMFTQQIARIGSQENVASIHRLSEAITELATSAKGLSGTGSALRTVERIAGKVGEGLNGGKGGTQAGSVSDIAGSVPKIESLPDSFASAKQEAEKVTENLADASNKAKEAQQSVIGMANAMKEAAKTEISVAPDKQTLHPRSPEELASMRRDIMNRTEPLDSGRIGAYDTLKNAGDKAAMAAEKSAPKFAGAAKSAEGYAESIGHVEKAARPANTALETTAEDAGAAGRAFMMFNGKLGMLMMKAEGLYEKLGKGILSGEMSSLEMAKTGLAASSTGDEIAKLDKKMAEMSVPKEMSKGIADTFVTANEKIGLLSMKLEALKEKLGSGIKAGTLDTKGMAELGMQIMNVTAKIEKLKAEAASAAKSADEMTSAFVRTRRALVVQELQEFGQGILKVASAINHLPGTVGKMGSTFKKIKNSIIDTNGGLIGFLHSMMRVAKFRLFRSLLRHITEGFSDGLKNLREYSKAMDNLFHKDITGLDNTMFKMKNALGASLGSILQSLIPLFQQLSQWVITAANYVNQFIALISGRTTWIRAVDAVAADFEKTKDNAAGAAKEAKNLLASWDELNIIQSKSGGGGSGSGNDINGDYKDLFEEVDEFDQKVKDAVLWLEEHMEIVKDLAFLAVGKLLGFRTWTVALVIGLKGAWEAGADIGENGLTDENLRKLAISGLEGTVGGMLAGLVFTKTLAGAALGAITGFTASLVVAALSSLTNGNWDPNNPIVLETLKQWAIDAIGLTVAGGVIGFETGGFKGMMIGALTGLTVSLAISAITTLTEGDGTNGGWTSALMNSKVILIAKHALAAIIGFKATGGTLLGAVTGLGISIAIDAIVGFDGNGSTSSKEMSSNLRQTLTLTAATMAGAIAGYKLTGGSYKGILIGAIAGFGIAAVTDLIIEVNKAKQEQKAKARNSAYGQIKLLDAQIESMVKSFFRYDVDVYLDVTDKTISDLNTRRSEAIEKINKLSSDFEYYARIGWANATPEEVQKLKETSEGVINDINEYLRLQDAFIKMHFALTGDMEGEGGELVETFLSNNTIISKYVSDLGQRIGSILEDNVVDSFEEDLLADLQRALNRVTIAITTGKTAGGFKAEVQQLQEKYGVNELDKDSRIAFEKEYKELETRVKETAWKDAAEVQKDLFAQATALEVIYNDEYVEKGLAETEEAKELKAKVDAAWKAANDFDIAARAQELYDLYIAPGKELHDKLIREQSHAVSNAVTTASPGVVTDALVDYGWEKAHLNIPVIKGIGKWIDKAVLKQADSEAGASWTTDVSKAREVLETVGREVFGDSYDTYIEGLRGNGSILPEWDIFGEDARREFLEYFDRYGKAVDIFLFEMLTGHPNYKIATEAMNKQAEYDMLTKQKPYSAKDILEGVLSFFDPADDKDVEPILRILGFKGKDVLLRDADVLAQGMADAIGVPIEMAQEAIRNRLKELGITEDPFSQAVEPAPPAQPTPPATEKDVMQGLIDSGIFRKYRIIDLGEGRYALGYAIGKGKEMSQWFDEAKMSSKGVTYDDLMQQLGSAKDIQKLIADWIASGFLVNKNYLTKEQMSTEWTMGDLKPREAGGPTEYEIIAEDSQVSVPADAVYVTPAHDLTPISPPGAPSYEEPGGEGDSKGASSDNQELILNRMQDIITALSQIYKKEFSAVLVPSAATGQVVDESLAMYDQTRG